MTTALKRPLRAHWVCRDRLGIVRIREIEVLSIDREAGTARVAFREGERRIERQQPVPFRELASAPQKAVRLAFALLSADDKNLPPPPSPAGGKRRPSARRGSGSRRRANSLRRGRGRACRIARARRNWRWA
jgi:hypothetical protein